MNGTDPRPVSASALMQAIPEPVADCLATDLAVSRERLPVALAEFLPAAVTGVSENGRLTPQPTFASTQVIDKPRG